MPSTYTLLIMSWIAVYPDLSTNKYIDFPSKEECQAEVSKIIAKLDDNIILVKCYKKSELRNQK